MMRTVGIIYLLVILALVVTQWAGKAEDRAERLLKLLLSPQTLAAMIVGLGGQEFGAAFKDLLSSLG